MIAWLAASAMAASSPAMEIYGAHTLLWVPFEYETTDGWSSTTPPPDRGPLHGGGGVRHIFGTGPLKLQWTAGLDTQFWGATWQREPTAVRARMQQYALEGGLMRRWSDFDDHLSFQISGGGGPMHQRLARPDRRTLPAWGSQWALGAGLTGTAPSGWGASLDGRAVTRIANRETIGTVQSAAGDYRWTWTPSSAHWELRLALVIPLRTARQ